MLFENVKVQSTYSSIIEKQQWGKAGARTPGRELLQIHRPQWMYHLYQWYQIYQLYRLRSILLLFFNIFLDKPGPFDIILDSAAHLAIIC